MQQHFADHSRLVGVTARRDLLAVRQRRRVHAMQEEALHGRQHAGLGRVRLRQPRPRDGELHLLIFRLYIGTFVSS